MSYSAIAVLTSPELVARLAAYVVCDPPSASSFQLVSNLFRQALLQAELSLAIAHRHNHWDAAILFIRRLTRLRQLILYATNCSNEHVVQLLTVPANASSARQVLSSHPVDGAPAGPGAGLSDGAQEADGHDAQPSPSNNLVPHPNLRSVIIACCFRMSFGDPTLIYGDGAARQDHAPVVSSSSSGAAFGGHGGGSTEADTNINGNEDIDAAVDSHAGSSATDGFKPYSHGTSGADSADDDDDVDAADDAPWKAGSAHGDAMPQRKKTSSSASSSAARLGPSLLQTLASLPQLECLVLGDGGKLCWPRGLVLPKLAVLALPSTELVVAGDAAERAARKAWREAVAAEDARVAALLDADANVHTPSSSSASSVIRRPSPQPSSSPSSSPASSPSQSLIGNTAIGGGHGLSANGIGEPVEFEEGEPGKPCSHLFEILTKHLPSLRALFLGHNISSAQGLPRALTRLLDRFGGMVGVREETEDAMWWAHYVTLVTNREVAADADASGGARNLQDSGDADRDRHVSWTGQPIDASRQSTLHVAARQHPEVAQPYRPGAFAASRACTDAGIVIDAHDGDGSGASGGTVDTRSGSNAGAIAAGSHVVPAPSSSNTPASSGPQSMASASANGSSAKGFDAASTAQIHTPLPSTTPKIDINTPTGIDRVAAIGRGIAAVQERLRARKAAAAAAAASTAASQTVAFRSPPGHGLQSHSIADTGASRIDGDRYGSVGGSSACAAAVGVGGPSHRGTTAAAEMPSVSDGGAADENGVSTAQPTGASGASQRSDDSETQQLNNRIGSTISSDTATAQHVSSSALRTASASSSRKPVLLVSAAKLERRLRAIVFQELSTRYDVVDIGVKCGVGAIENALLRLAPDPLPRAHATQQQISQASVLSNFDRFCDHVRTSAAVDIGGCFGFGDRLRSTSLHVPHIFAPSSTLAAATSSASSSFVFAGAGPASTQHLIGHSDRGSANQLHHHHAENHDPCGLLSRYSPPCSRDPSIQHLIVERRDDRGCSPLFRAAEAGAASACVSLCGAGATVCSHNHRRESPLYIAALKGHCDVMRVLLVRWRDECTTELAACAGSDAAAGVTVKQDRTAGLDGAPDARIPAEGMPPLNTFNTATGTYRGISGPLFNVSATSDLQDALCGPDGWTCLHAACIGVNLNSGSASSSSAAAGHGGGANATAAPAVPVLARRGSSGRRFSAVAATATASHGTDTTVGAHDGDAGCTHAFSGADPSRQIVLAAGSNSYIGAESGSIAILRMLLYPSDLNGCDVAPRPTGTPTPESLIPVDSPNARGQTPLHIAARCGQAEAVSLLLQAGADPTLVDHARETPSRTASAHGHHAIALMLRSAETAWRRQPATAAAGAQRYGNTGTTSTFGTKTPVVGFSGKHDDAGGRTAASSVVEMHHTFAGGSGEQVDGDHSRAAAADADDHHDGAHHDSSYSAAAPTDHDPDQHHRPLELNPSATPLSFVSTAEARLRRMRGNNSNGNRGSGTGRGWFRGRGMRS